MDSEINLDEGKMSISNNLVSTYSGTILKDPKTSTSYRTLEPS
ncbi:hypothetical protein [Clostridium sp. 19966]|nr:hypothetical protein [Clostridium sp. 19966]